jgi:hypothetical protein
MLLPISDTQVDALVEQRIAEMSDREFCEMCARTRPPLLGAGDEQN